MGATNEHLRTHAQWHAQNTMHPEDANTYGDDFVAFHREMGAHYDAWRAEQGFAPVVAWDPSTPMPPEFAYPRMTGCLPRRTDDPKVELPTWATVEGGDEPSPEWGYRSLCEFPSLNRFAKAIDASATAPAGFVLEDSYHSAVHNRVAGDLAPPETAPRDPIFYAWHKHVDLLFVSWETSCGGAVETVSAPDAAPAESARAVPGPGVAGLAAALGVLALLRRR